ncbi:MAG: ferredoxin [Methanosphaera sp. rholeuAM130]|nr:4Fe-4S binding protein [Methanosphaera sp.]RAP53975.1 MAG: ferredoxin [Methanosphaera sp. rholeuAM130]
MTVSLFADKCDGIDECPENGMCIKICALNAISNINDLPQIDDDNCSNCGLCILSCPNEALSN